MTQPRIEKRLLTKTEITSLVDGIKNTVNITGFTKNELKSFGVPYVAEINGKLVGVAYATPLSKDWSELAILFIWPEFRGKGIGTALFETAWREMVANHQSIYIVSRTKSVIELMQSKGMKFVGLINLPWSVKRDVIYYALKSIYRIKEFVRKLIVFPGAPAYHYAIKPLHDE